MLNRTWVYGMWIDVISGLDGIRRRMSNQVAREETALPSGPTRGATGVEGAEVEREVREKKRS